MLKEFIESNIEYIDYGNYEVLLDTCPLGALHQLIELLEQIGIPKARLQVDESPFASGVRDFIYEICNQEDFDIDTLIIRSITYSINVSDVMHFRYHVHVDGKEFKEDTYMAVDGPEEYELEWMLARRIVKRFMKNPGSGTPSEELR